MFNDASFELDAALESKSIAGTQDGPQEPRPQLVCKSGLILKNVTSITTLCLNVPGANQPCDIAFRLYCSEEA